MLLIAQRSPLTVNHSAPLAARQIEQIHNIHEDACLNSFESFPNAVLFLVENALTGGDFFECARNSDMPIFMWIIAFMYLTIGGLLLLNMLIAMSTHTGRPAHVLCAYPRPHRAFG